MTIKYINLEEILRLHFQLIEDFGGSHGVRDENRLKSVTEAPKQVVFRKTQYATLFEKAAVYLRNIIGDHPFSDENQRTAVTVCGIFLARNGNLLSVSPQDLEDFVVEIATGHLNIIAIARWLEAHTS